MASRPSPRRVAVLASGGGSNLQALFDYLDALGARRAAEVVLVASDRADAGALERAMRHGVTARVLDAHGRTAGLADLLTDHGAELVVLAGYLRLVPNDVTRAWRGHIVNVHPALLPAFGGPGMYGDRVHAAVLASGARVSGVTVHFVDEQYDRGAIIAQWPVPVLPGDTPPVLAERVLAVEHLLYPRVIQRLAAGAIRLRDDGMAEGWSIKGHVFIAAGGLAALGPALDSDHGDEQ
jgi:formyltetrahydrofolate-dependent phosphoribosylglycinamide formyltransferase